MRKSFILNFPAFFAIFIVLPVSAQTTTETTGNKNISIDSLVTVVASPSKEASNGKD
jgi:hypothetical protein